MEITHVIRYCKHHGETNFVFESSTKYYRCKKCRSEAVSKKRKRTKLDLVKHFGGKCKICNYSKCVEALEFHHLDSTTKQFGISAKGFTKAYNKLLEEANKCILVCANCHRELETNKNLFIEE